MPSLGELLDALIESGHIASARWGKDHFDTLLYVDTRIVDHRGCLLAYRADSPRGPEGSDPHMRMDMRYPTRLAEDKTLRGHTDYDCLADAIAAGFLSIARTDTSIVAARLRPVYPEPVPEDPLGDDLLAQGNQIQYAWTEQGYALIARLRRWRADGKPTGEFRV